VLVLPNILLVSSYLVILSPSLSCFISHLSSGSIPKTVHDALFDSGGGEPQKWKSRSYFKMGLASLFPYPKVKGMLVANGSILFSLTLIDPLKD
jgi:hypothetical protein